MISRLPVGCWNFHIHCLPVAKYSVASAGGRDWSKKTLVPQPNITSVMTRGITDQTTSRVIELWSSLPNSPEWRRW